MVTIFSKEKRVALFYAPEGTTKQDKTMIQYCLSVPGMSKDMSEEILFSGVLSEKI